MSRLWLAVAALLAAPSLALADEPSGCAAFKWPVDQERAALLATKASVPNGGALPYGAAVTLTLVPMAEAGLPQPPERAPKADRSYAGHFTLAAPAKPGLYRITLASEGWIDAVDNGAFIKSKGFSGAKDCEGARKIVRFDLPAHPVIIQVSGAHDTKLSAIVTPAE